MTMLQSVLATDLWFENLLLVIRTPFLLHLFGGITLLGEVTVVLGITTLVGIVLWTTLRYRAYATGLVVTIIGAAATNYVLKTLVGRARPSGLIPSLIETSSSFPSGHATAAMVLYGFLAYFLCALFPTRKTAIVTAATVLIGGIGFSRLYLGVHFPSDVLAGYLLGALWILIGIAVVKRYNYKETI